MALVPKLELRQGQQLVMTPQLQQAIRLLQLSNVELCSFVEAEVERNPLLESEEVAPEPGPEGEAKPRSGDDDGDEATIASGSAGERRVPPQRRHAHEAARRTARPHSTVPAPMSAAGPRCGSARAMPSAARRATSRTSSRPAGRWPIT